MHTNIIITIIGAIIVLGTIGVVKIQDFSFSDSQPKKSVEEPLQGEGQLPLVANERSLSEEAIKSCDNKSVGDNCEFDDRGTVSQGLCDDKPGVLACSPNREDRSDPREETKATEEPDDQKQGITISTIKDSIISIKDSITPTTTSSTTYQSCLSNTKDEPECKDCCDCLSDADGATRTSCRNSCATSDYSENSDFITIESPSILGVSGDYSQCTATSDSGSCKACCEESMGLQCGDYRHCRTACNSTFGDSPGGGSSDSGQEQPSQSSGGAKFNIEQALSDRAQQATIAFSALAYLTGDLCADSFLPPGKVADFSGFQYLRDNDPDEMGHNTDFVTISGNNVLHILNNAQLQMLEDGLAEQTSLLEEFAYYRFPLMDAFRRQYSGDIPSGSSGLDKDAVIEYSAELFRKDGQISLMRAELFGEIIRSLDDSQREYLDAMVGQGMLSWPEVTDEDLAGKVSGNLRGYGSELFGWYAGSVEADAYFNPERNAMYFGAFYMKDAPAMGVAGYIIGSEVTAESGDAVFTVLDDTQGKLITDLVDEQKTALYGVADVRAAIATELRKLMTQESIDEENVLSLAENYGRLDGEIAYYYAVNFAEVEDSLTDSQQTQLVELRDLDDFPCSGAYLYSDKISMPSIRDTDFLF